MTVPQFRPSLQVRGRTIDNISEQYLETVKPAYETYIKNYIGEADFAVMRGGKNRMAIDAISAYLTTKVLAERFDADTKTTTTLPPNEQTDRAD